MQVTATKTRPVRVFIVICDICQVNPGRRQLVDLLVCQECYDEAMAFTDEKRQELGIPIDGRPVPTEDEGPAEASYGLPPVF